MSLMRAMRDFPLPEGHIAMWFLGQSSFVFKSPRGTLAGVDLYLTDSCAGLAPPLDLRRQVPVLVPPEEMEVDVFICTHNHQDHTDPETLRNLPNKDRTEFVGPPPSCQAFRVAGVPEDRIRMAWPDCDLRMEDLRLRGAFALPTDWTDLNHLGYVLSFGDGPRIYITGDTAEHELLASARRLEPDVMITVINPGFGNLSPWQAARLAAKIRPVVAIPCHYDLFADNAADPRQFRTALAVLAPEVRYHELRHGQAWVYPQGL